MIPCSAYCRPDEGIHVYLDFIRRNDWDEAKKYVGMSLTVLDKSHTVCVPDGTDFVLLDIEEAKEANIKSREPEFDTAVLLTIRTVH